MGLKANGADDSLNALVSGVRYVSLHTADPTISNELGSAGSYARVSVPAGSASTGHGWIRSTVSSFRRLANLAKIVFTTPTATWSGAPTHWAVRTAMTGTSDSIKFTGTTGISAAPTSGQPVEFDVGRLYIEYDIDD